MNTVHRFSEPYPPRFETLEDAALFMECFRTNKDFPKEKHIPPFELKNGMIIPSQRYKDAPYERGLIWNENAMELIK